MVTPMKKIGYPNFLNNFFLFKESKIKNKVPSMAKVWDIVTEAGNVIMNKLRNNTEILDKFIPEIQVINYV